MCTWQLGLRVVCIVGWHTHTCLWASHTSGGPERPERMSQGVVSLSMWRRGSEPSPLMETITQPFFTPVLLFWDSLTGIWDLPFRLDWLTRNLSISTSLSWINQVHASTPTFLCEFWESESEGNLCFYARSLLHSDPCPPSHKYLWSVVVESKDSDNAWILKADYRFSMYVYLIPAQLC